MKTINEKRNKEISELEKGNIANKGTEQFTKNINLII